MLRQEQLSWKQYCYREAGVTQKRRRSHSKSQPIHGDQIACLWPGIILGADVLSFRENEKWMFQGGMKAHGDVLAAEVRHVDKMIWGAISIYAEMREL